MHACVDNLIDMYPQRVRETSFGLVDGVNDDCLGVPDRPTLHGCWPSRSAFQVWQCLDNTSQCRCWRWKPIELSEEEMFTAFVHCGALLDLECEKARGRDEHALKLQWSFSWRQNSRLCTATHTGHRDSPRSRPCTNWSGRCMYGFGEIELKVWVPSIKTALSFVPLATREQKWRRRFAEISRFPTTVHSSKSAKRWRS